MINLKPYSQYRIWLSDDYSEKEGWEKIANTGPIIEFLPSQNSVTEDELLQLIRFNTDAFDSMNKKSRQLLGEGHNYEYYYENLETTIYSALVTVILSMILQNPELHHLIRIETID